MLGNLIGGFITILVGATLIPSVANEIYSARYCNSTPGSQSCNSSWVHMPGSASTILGLVTLFFALGIMSIGVAVTAQGLRAAGMLGV